MGCLPELKEYIDQVAKQNKDMFSNSLDLKFED